MAPRTRRRIGGPALGFFEQKSSTNYYTDREDPYSYDSSCTDNAGIRDNALTVDHQWVTGHLLTTKYCLNPSCTQYKLASNFAMRYFQSASGSVSHLTSSSRPPNSSLAVKLLAATNPSKPVIDLPVSILELRELPHLLKTTGDTLIKTFAKKNLNREFGLTPLMSDALSLLTMSDEVAKRVKLFKELREKPLVRKAGLFDDTVIQSPSTVTPSNTAPSFCTVSHTLDLITTSIKVWGYVTWTPSNAFNKGNLDYSDPALEFLARRAVTGTQLGLVTAWNALPWTWLFDWFGNIGDWLEANRHVVPASPSLPRICETRITRMSYSLASSNMGLAPGSMPITRHRTTKTRTLVSATLPSAYLPLLTERQVGILASLAILRL